MRDQLMFMLVESTIGDLHHVSLAFPDVPGGTVYTAKSRTTTINLSGFR